MSDLPAPDVRYAGDTMGQRLKTYEALSDPRLPVGSFYAIRLDGKGFSKYTKKIKAQKPFDLDLMGIMDGVCRDLLLEFHFATVYTQSDEITCIPYFFGDNREAAFSGRLQKLSSVLASYAAASFARHLNAAIGRRPSFATNAYATFDCRVFAVPTKEELLNVLIWRQRDCEKNAKNGFAQSYFSHKALLKKNSDEQVRMVEEMHQVLFEDMNPLFRMGSFYKKDLVEHVGFNPKKGVMETSLRGKIVPFTRSLHFNEYDLTQMLSKYANMLDVQEHPILTPSEFYQVVEATDTQFSV